MIKAVSLALILTLFRRTVGRVTYLMGAKPSLGADSAAFTQSDCSGWVRWVLDRAGLRLPDGSAAQHEWCEQQRLPKVAYTNAATLADSSRLFLCFIAPFGSEAGHVWLLNAGRTMECHGHGGVDSRPWNTPALRNVCACYELPVTA